MTKRKVFAAFEVDDSLELSDVALALEIRFKADGGTATAWSTFIDATIDYAVAQQAEHAASQGLAITSVDDLPRITDDADWVELAVGATALLFGKLDNAVTPDTVNLRVVNAAWQQFVVEAGSAIVPKLADRTPVCLLVERVEDGLRLVSIEEIAA